MSRTLAVCALVALGLGSASAVVYACGDKLVVLGRGVRFERIHLARNPGAVLVFLNPDSNLARADEEFHLSASLELAGHAVQIVGSEAELERAWRSGGADVILADLGDANALWESMGSDGTAPEVVPVLYKPTREDLAQAERLSKCTSQAAKRKSRSLLNVVDELIGQRRKGEPAVCGPVAEKAAS